MRLSAFILTNMEPILKEWEEFARSLGAITSNMDRRQLRNHAELVLSAIAADMETLQTPAQQKDKSTGNAPLPPPGSPETAATSHGSVRAGEGFTLDQMVSEYRALRASVLRLWARHERANGDQPFTADSYEQQVRFHEAVDEALTESIHMYALAVDQLFAAKARRRMEAMGTLAAGLGHDMANVLMPMRTCLATLASRGVTEETAPLVEALRRAMDHLSGLSRGLRSFAMDPESVAGFADHTDVHDWWATAISPFTWALPKGVRLHVEGLDAGSPPLPPVRVPAHVLMQATFNLVQNAAQALMQENLDAQATGQAPRGGNIWVSATCDATAGAEAGADAGADGNVVRITVRDDGPGMDPSTVLRCTDAFFTTKSRNFGSGLGLYVVRNVLERHGARLHVASQVGVGSTFTILLPAGPRDVSIQVPRAANRAKEGQK